MQSLHRPIGERDGSRWLALAAVAQRHPDAWTMSVVPGGLDEESSHVAVAGLGDGAEAALLARAVLAWDEADEGHQPPRRSEAFEVVQLDGEADGGDGVEASEAPQRGDGAGVSRVDGETLQVNDQILGSLLNLVDGEEVVGDDGRVGGAVERSDSIQWR